MGNRSLPRRSHTPRWPLRIEATNAERMSVRLPLLTSTETPRRVCRCGYSESKTGFADTSTAHSAPSIVATRGRRSRSARCTVRAFSRFRCLTRFEASERMSRKPVAPALRSARLMAPVSGPSRSPSMPRVSQEMSTLTGTPHSRITGMT
jgi:hypothetical protein